MNGIREKCQMRHPDNGNCLPAGGFCTAVNNLICAALHDAYDLGKAKSGTEITAEQEGICPLCGAEVEYAGENIIDDDGGVFPWTCPNCGAHGKESYRS